MFDFSFAEIALIVVVAVLFIGPDELPVVIRAVGKAMRGARSLAREMRGLMEEISRESGLEEAARDVTMIRGDDGKMYEAYHFPPPAGGRVREGASLEGLPGKPSPRPSPRPGEGEES